MTNEYKREIAKLARRQPGYLKIVAEKVGKSTGTVHNIITDMYGTRKERKFDYSAETVKAVWDAVLVLAREQAELISKLNLPQE